MEALFGMFMAMTLICAVGVAYTSLNVQFNDGSILSVVVCLTCFCAFLGSAVWADSQVAEQPGHTVYVADVKEDTSKYGGLYAISNEGSRYEVGLDLAIKIKNGATTCKTKGGHNTLKSCTKG